jgi:hypothetical protein
MSFFSCVDLGIVPANRSDQPRYPILHAQPRSLVSVGHVWVAELCARAAGSEIIAAPQSYTMFSTGSP